MFAEKQVGHIGNIALLYKFATLFFNDSPCSKLQGIKAV